MNDKIELRLLGITYNQIESGVYALILEDPVSKRRLPIVIGYPEAQSIECNLQKVRTPRPLTHDLLANLLTKLNARLIRVDIKKLMSGPYAGILTVETLLGERLEVDARSSDAIALAIRVGAPIFAEKSLLDKEGYTPNVETQKADIRKSISFTGSKIVSEPRSIEQLKELLEKYVAEENYEKAAEIKKELEKRQKKE